MKRIEIQATEHSKVYAKVEGNLFSVGLISDLSDIIPDYKGCKIRDCKPFLTQECNESEMPEDLYVFYARRLGVPKEWTMGNEVMGLDEKVYGVPTCPNCGEVTYSEPRCPFCGQALKDPPISMNVSESSRSSFSVGPRGR